MHVCIHHHKVLPVKKYGGIERAVFWHMLELVRQGHQVTFIGPKESEVTKHGIKHIVWNKGEDWQKLVPDNIDIVHVSFPEKIRIDVPYVLNVQGNGFPGEKHDRNTVFCSKSHARNHNSTSYVNNAVDMREYPINYTSNKITEIEHLLFLAKASWRVKNLKQSLKIALKTNKHLHICGGNSILGIHPLIHNHGMVGGDNKLSIMQKCDALLFPVRWHEPFGIAIIEAMTQGIPVFGSSFGSLPDLIVKGTGRTFYSHEEIIQYFKNGAEEFDRDFIRNHVIENYSIERFTKDFVEKYKIVLNGQHLNEEEPEWIYPFRAGKRLPF
ncbi:glycosyltransferase [Halobacteriovorax sp. XZX-3]|uniref:glycosyltransferase n=1 Tax=unclassified Halobacteriovorax TaxID=2639665 RepID=UPI000CD178BD|nr:glycosyltransferase [Halobacteriovorax sp. DA5]POB13803.1 hypothetical protein C0Z22_07025 [Halobacteriovorax sp. DA5]